MVKIGLRASALLLVVPLALAACSSETERAAAPEEESATEAAEESAATVTGSSATYIDVENQMVLEDGTPLTVTWKVSNTQNEYWDGNSRPDHEPPQGLQGLVQTPSSGPYNVRLEVNSTYISGRGKFSLTPTVTVDGQDIALKTLDFYSYLAYVCEKRNTAGNCSSGYNVPLWQAIVASDGLGACYGDKPLATYTANTPRGPISYGYSGHCSTDKQPSQFVIRTLN